MAVPRSEVLLLSLGRSDKSLLFAALDRVRRCVKFNFRTVELNNKSAVFNSADVFVATIMMVGVSL